MSSSGRHNPLWFVDHTFDLQGCGWPATSAAILRSTHPTDRALNPSISTKYVASAGLFWRGKTFAELGVAPPVRLERP